MEFISYIWCAVFALHIISIAYWTGGSLIMVQSDRNIFRNANSLEEQTLRLNAFRRFYKILLHVAPITLLSGGGLIGWMIQNHMKPSGAIHAMAVIGMIMFLIFLYVSLDSLKKASRSLRPDADALNKIRQKTTIMGLWGVLAIIMGAISHFNLF